jgi:hypothetical protein
LGLIGRAARALRIENTRDFRSLEKNSTQRRMIFPVCFVLPIWSASADINYLRKTAALFHEFHETGTSKLLKYSSAADLRANYPRFFLESRKPLCR